MNTSSKKLWGAIAAVVVIVLGVWIFGNGSSEATSQEEQEEEELKEMQPSKATGTINGHDYVDLGLSVKWATCNMGAATPSDYGDFYAWGEISPKKTYTKENSLTWEKRMEYLAGLRHEDPSTWGLKMEDIIGDSRYDAARVKWKGTWRLPSKKEMEELVYKCKHEYAKVNNIEGVLITGPNGNSIFLPANGDKQGDKWVWVKTDGAYWGGSPGDELREGCNIRFSMSANDRLPDDPYILSERGSSRYLGKSIRPVSE